MKTLKLEKEAKQVWLEYIKNNPLPLCIPPNPDEIYKDEWEGWANWLGWFTQEMN